MTFYEIWSSAVEALKADGFKADFCEYGKPIRSAPYALVLLESDDESDIFEDGSIGDVGSATLTVFCGAKFSVNQAKTISDAMTMANKAIGGLHAKYSLESVVRFVKMAKFDGVYEDCAVAYAEIGVYYEI